MKKLILLLLIPMITYSQTYNELMGIESMNDFKRVMIENGYEMGVEDDTYVGYGYNMEVEEGEEVAEKWGMYFKKYGVMVFTFNETPLDIFTRFGDYDDIVDNIKSKCEYDDIIVIDEGEEYVGYICSESKLDGKFGFNVIDKAGYIIFYPKP
tara:strand:- start:2 stop:460 length:459 start_codon:yes stop_codon:yes gene_type:complete